MEGILMEELVKQGPEVINSDEGVTQETVDEVVHDDNDPIEVLKAMATQLGVADIHLLTEKELRSIIDREVTKAIKTREEKLRKEQEMKLLQEQGKYEELLKLERKEALERVKGEFLESAQLTEFADLIDVNAYVDKPLAEAVTQLKDTLNRLKNYVDTLVEIRLKERINSLQRNPISTSTSSVSVSDIKQILSERLKNLG